MAGREEEEEEEQINSEFIKDLKRHAQLAPGAVCL
jgi:hypothetical protein